jgi:diadenosine tetraphosphatase ApaH/serine/threonine PP2A family protein phosphatase
VVRGHGGRQGRDTPPPLGSTCASFPLKPPNESHKKCARHAEKLTSVKGLRSSTYHLNLGRLCRFCHYNHPTDPTYPTESAHNKPKDG